MLPNQTHRRLASHEGGVDRKRGPQKCAFDILRFAVLPDDADVIRPEQFMCNSVGLGLNWGWSLSARRFKDV